MGVIAANQGLMITMWVVLVAIGLTALVNIARGLQGKFAVGEMADAVTRPMLLDVLPLIIIALLTKIDPTHVIVLIWYYVAAILIIIRNLLKLAQNLNR